MRIANVRGAAGAAAVQGSPVAGWAADGAMSCGAPPCAGRHWRPAALRTLLALFAFTCSAAAATDLTGLWKDDRGVQYRLRQSGSKLYWSADGTSSGGYANVFWGDISGTTITGSWIDLPGSPTLGPAGNLVLRIETDDRLTRVSGNYGTQYLVRQGSGSAGPGGAGPAGYLGCFKDTYDRALDGPGLSNGEMTLSKCVSFCQQQGFPYAGAQNGDECLCGRGNYARHGPATNCDKQCFGDRSQMCGGFWAMSVYATGASPQPSGPCADSRTQGVMDDWLNRAVPPDNQRPGYNLRYEPWGRLVGTSPTAVITATNKPDTALTRCEWLWQRATQLASTNLGTMKQYLDQQGIR